MSQHDHDPVTNRSDNQTFDSVLIKYISRRGLMQGTGGAAAMTMLGSVALVACSDDDDNNGGGDTDTPTSLGFTAVPHSDADTVLIPAGYSARVLYALGDPIAAGVADYSNDGTQGDFDQRSGDHHDGMHYFPIDGSSSNGIIAINHENLTRAYLHANGPTDIDGVRPQSEVVKEMNAHGVAVFEVKAEGGVWSVVQDSGFNRRITPFTEMRLSGPVAGSDYAKTRYSTDGSKTRGTFNNCANGYTPWGTYLTCEENWAFYFHRDEGDDRGASENALLARYGISPGAAGNYGWTTVEGDEFQRLDITVKGASAAVDYRNEAYTYGYIVEIDPYDKTVTPAKRTAMGRFFHEGCWVGPVESGKPLVFYMGCDARNEYIYKFVSDQAWDSADADADDRMAAGDKYLGAGTLYVAKFNADGTGEWLELSQGINGLSGDNTTYPFATQADVLVATRLAADSVGATPMDRPEWGAVNPVNGEVYFTLTNSSSSSSGRGQGGGGSLPVDAANPRSYDDDADGDSDGNANGHIIRWRENGDPDAVSFNWDIFAFGSPESLPANINLSQLDASNDFSSPDGLWFDDGGILWIQTDDGAYTDVTNCMMLAALPGSVGDGTAITTSSGQDSFVGVPPGDTLRRFLVGPKECEITGITMTPDRKTMFVNIQHPGEDGDADAPSSNWPAASGVATDTGAAGARPRSATVVITKDDGGVIGL